VTDQRVRKQCTQLAEAGFRVTLFGRRLAHSLPIQEVPFEVVRYSLWFNKKALFYANLNLRLFASLLTAKCHLFYANDLDTLPAAALASLIRAKPLVYDSHEFFTEVPEVQHRPWVKHIWKWLERICIKRAALVLTVNGSIANLLRERYALPEVLVVRNVPLPSATARNGTIPTPLPDFVKPHTPLLVLQGSGINVDRGAEELVMAMRLVPEAVLLIIGSGDALPALRLLVEQYPELHRKVVFLPRMPYPDMMAYTRMASIALSLDKATNINYRYSLPNKLFDYIAAGVPVLVSDLVELRRIVTEHDIGRVVTGHDPHHIAETITNMLADEAALERYRAQAAELAATLNWKVEFKPVVERISVLCGV
jgi:glycosyltransferase involved in cell wall biosynthesis